MEYYLFSCKYLNEIKSVILRNAIKNPLTIRAEKTFIQILLKEVSDLWHKLIFAQLFLLNW